MTLALRTLDIKKGDVVLLPTFTFFASAEVVSLNNADYAFVDIDADTFNISTESLERLIKKLLKDGKYNPKAIIAVDLFGQCANYMEIREIAKKYNLYIIEDGAQGFGGSINGKMACSFGYISTTSFFPAEPLGCYGDGGAIQQKLLKVALIEWVMLLPKSKRLKKLLIFE